VFSRQHLDFLHRWMRCAREKRPLPSFSPLESSPRSVCKTTPPPALLYMRRLSLLRRTIPTL